MAIGAELGLILLFSVLGGVLAVRFKQPSVLGLLIVGAIVGPNSLGLIKDTGLIEAAIEIGAVLLLFTVGIEFSLQHLLNLGLRAILITVIKLGSVFLISYYISLFLGFGVITSLYLGVILSITSTVIVIKILNQKNLYNREETPLLIAVLILEDIFGVFALTFFSSIETKAELTPLSLFTDLIFSLTIMAIAYLILQRILKPVIKWLVKYSTEETITFASLGLCGGMSYLSLLLGLSPSVGAFLAGNIVASLPNSKMFEKAIHPFILTFTSLFFFSIGTIVDFSVVMGSISLILVLFFASIIIKFLSIGFGSYLFTNFTGRQAVFSGIAMISLGEFSLLIAKEANLVGLGIDLVSITATIILLSSIAMSYMLAHTEKIYNAIFLIMPIRAKDDMVQAAKFFNSVSFRMIKDRIRTRKVLVEWKTILNNLVAIFFIVIAAFFAWRYFRSYLSGILPINLLFYLIAALLVFAIFFPALNVFKNSKKLIEDMLKFFIRIYPTEMANEKKIFRNFILLSVAFAALFVFPSVFLLLELHPLYHLVVLLLVLLIIFYALRSSSLIHIIENKHAAGFEKISKKYKVLLKKRMKLEKK